MKVVPFKNLNKNNEEYEDFETRYAIADDEGKIVDDAQGYGYKTAQKAHKAMWYKFQNGKQKIKSTEANRKKFFKECPGLDKFLQNIYEWNFKEIARGEVSDEDILNDVKEKFNVDMPKEYLKNWLKNS